MISLHDTPDDITKNVSIELKILSKLSYELCHVPPEFRQSHLVSTFDLKAITEGDIIVVFDEQVKNFPLK